MNFLCFFLFRMFYGSTFLFKNEFSMNNQRMGRSTIRENVMKLKSIQHCSKLIETEYFQDIGTDNNQSGYIIVALIWMITFSIE